MAKTSTVETRAISLVDIEQAAKAYQDYKVRADSWKTRTLAGQPAVSVVIDYIENEKKMVEYYTSAIKGSQSLDLSMHVAADKLDEFKPDFDSILDNVEVK